MGLIIRGDKEEFVAEKSKTSSEVLSTNCVDDGGSGGVASSESITYGPRNGEM
jgi:hypothetical protein